jgi:hypothetical protein
MRYLFHLGHPAHFHLFKNCIYSLKAEGHEVDIMIKKKDVLEDLLKASGLDYVNVLPKGRADNKIALAWSVLKTDLKIMAHCLRRRPNYLVGTSIAIGHVGKLLRIKNINVNEDDADVVPLYSKLSYPFADLILAPTTCSNGKWESKSLKYPSYHELAYLHPKVFSADRAKATEVLGYDGRYFIMRFAKLNAHHDDGIQGITDELALKIIDLLKPHGRVYITSEREFDDKRLEQYRVNINPIDMHNIMAFASLYIGDSQTMAAEAGVLGTPFIRYNDFVGRIGYLKELEEVYNLGIGLRPGEPKELLAAVQSMMDNFDTDIFDKRRAQMLHEKISLSEFITNLLLHYNEELEEFKGEGKSYFSKYIYQT